MKNKIRLLIFSIFLISSALYAESSFRLSVEPIFGFRDGYLGEFVYELSNKTQSYEKLSQLDWDFNDQFFLGGKISAEYRNFGFNIYSAGFFPKKCNDMVDSDWVNLDSTKTNLSYSECKNKKSFFIGSDLSYCFPVFSFFSVRAGSCFEYGYYFMTAENGYGWYGNNSAGTNVPWYSSEAVFYPKGKLAGVELTRNTFYTWLFVEPVFYITKYAEISLFYKLSPYSYFKAIDHHTSLSKTNTGTFYYDNGNAFFKGHQLGFKITGKPLKNIEASFKYSFHIVNFFMGTDSINGQEEDSAYSNPSEDVKSGFNEHWSDFTFSVTYRFF